MAEESQEKKKPGCCRQIFKWIGLGLLSLLIIAATFFHAPWKVITLLLIILAACTALPKPARKWFWLSAGAVVIALIIWVFLPDDNEDWRPYTFDEEIALHEAKYAIPDEENAAMIYNKLFEDFDIDSNQPEFFIKSKPSSKDESWLSKDHPETAEWLKGHQKTIDTLIEISRKEKCKFSIAVGPASLAQYMKRLPKMRRSTFLLVSTANNDIAEGRINAGIEKYLCIVQMAYHQYQQPILIDLMVGFAIESLALGRVNRFVIEGQPSGKQLRLIANSIKDLQNNWGSDWQKILDFEKLYAKNMLCGMAYETNPKGEVRRSRHYSIATKRSQSAQEVRPLRYWRRKLAKTGTIMAWFFVPSTPRKYTKIIDANYEKYYAMAKPDFDWNKEPSKSRRLWEVNYRSIIELLANILEPSYRRIHEIYLKNLSLRRGSRLLIAIKQYNIENGNWPVSLDAIKSEAPAEAFIDPVTGGQFEYENHGKYFSLYGETINIWPK